MFENVDRAHFSYQKDHDMERSFNQIFFSFLQISMIQKIFVMHVI